MPRELSHHDTEEWPPRAERVMLAQMFSHHYSRNREIIEESDRIGPLTIEQRLVPLIDEALETFLQEAATNGNRARLCFEFINEEVPQEGARIGIEYVGAPPELSDLQNETTTLGRLYSAAQEHNAKLSISYNSETGISGLKLRFPFFSENTD